MMSTYSGLTVSGGQKEEIRMDNGKLVKFKYPETVSDHYRYMGGLYNNNLLRRDCGTKSQTGLDSSWKTTWWSIRVFDFFIACTEVNSYLEMKYFLKTDETLMEFRENWPRCLFTTYISMYNNVAVHKKAEIEIYHTY